MSDAATIEAGLSLDWLAGSTKETQRWGEMSWSLNEHAFLRGGFMPDCFGASGCARAHACGMGVIDNAKYPDDMRWEGWASEQCGDGTAWGREDLGYQGIR